MRKLYFKYWYQLYWLQVILILSIPMTVTAYFNGNIGYNPKVGHRYTYVPISRTPFEKPNEPLTNTVIETKSGWVKYKSQHGFESTMKISSFRCFFDIRLDD